MRNLPVKKFAIVAALAALAGCGGETGTDTAQTPGNTVETSGKTDVAIADVPSEVLAAARTARPGFAPAEAQSETREGRRYFDVGGKLPGGSEIEFDIMEEGGRWRVVEMQRDIALSEAPAPVRAAAAEHEAAFTPARIIESDQTDGIVIYELFGPEGGEPQGRKVEIKWDGSKAQVLTTEWAH
jgi:hypothetical protein